VIETKNIPNLSPELELLQKENEMLRGKLSTKESLISDLRFQLDQMRRTIFGHKSERFVPENPDQLLLDFDLGEIVPIIHQEETITYTRLKKENKAAQPNVRLAIPAHLPRVIEIIEPDNLPVGSKKIGEEITEVMEITPARIYVRCIIRPKYALPQEKGISIAYLPSLPLPKSNAGASLIAHLIVNKYVNHLPFYRQVQMFKRDGIDLAESTINNWFAKTADLLQPLYDRIWKHIREADHLFADETTIPVLNVDKPGGTVKGYHWIFKRIDPASYFSTTTKAPVVIIYCTRFCPAFRELCNATAMEHTMNWTTLKALSPLVVGRMHDASLNKHWRMILCRLVMPCSKYKNFMLLNEKQLMAILHAIKSRNSEKRNHSLFSRILKPGF